MWYAFCRGRLSRGLYVILVCALLPLSLPAAELVDQLQLFLPGTTTSDRAGRAFVERQLQHLIRQLEISGIQKRSVKKSVPYLRQQVEARFFKQVAEDADLLTMTQTGNFNQTSAAAIYALLLEHFDIPYQIRADLWEVYVIADPIGEHLPLFPPGNRQRIAPREKAFVRDYLQLLRNLAIPSEADWQRPEMELFQKYYFGSDERMSLSQLAAFAHYQQALRAYERKAYPQTLDHLRLADQLSVRPAFDVLRRATIYQLADRGQGDSRESLFYLFELRREHSGEDFQAEIRRRFERVVEEQLRQRHNPRALDSVYAIVCARTSGDARLRTLLGETYCRQRIRYHADRQETQEVLRFVDSLYRYRPDDVALQEILAAEVVKPLTTERDYRLGLPRTEQALQRYPFLRQHPLFCDMDLHYRAERIRAVYDADDARQGQQYLNEFAQLLMRYPVTERRSSWIVTAYLAASNYHFRRGEYRAAEAVLERAYALAPQDHYLLHRLELLKNY